MSEDIYLIAKAERERDRKLGRKMAGASTALGAAGVANLVGPTRRLARETRGMFPDDKAERITQRAAEFAASRRGRLGGLAFRGAGYGLAGATGIGALNMIQNSREYKRLRREKGLR